MPWTSSPGESRRRRSASRRRTMRRSSCSSQNRRPISWRCCRTQAPFPCIARRWPQTRRISRSPASRSRTAHSCQWTGRSARISSPCGTRITGTMRRRRLASVRYVHVADPMTELTRFRAGDLDVTYTIPPGEMPRLEKELPGQLHVAPHVGVYYYGLALDQPPFQDAPTLRRALAMAIDREVLTKQVLGDGETARVQLGAARHRGLRTAEVRRGQGSRRKRASRKRSGSMPRPATRRRARLLSNCVPARARCTTASRSP